MKTAICLAFLVATPATAATYTVTIDAASLGEVTSTFEALAFAVSTFAEQAQPSSGDFSSQTSTFELQGMDEETRKKTEEALTDLGAKLDGRDRASTH